MLHWKISPYFYCILPNIRKGKIRNHPFMRSGVWSWSFKKYVCSKLPALNPLSPCSFLFVLHEPPSPLPQCMFALVSWLPLLSLPLPVCFSLLFKDLPPPPSRQTYFLNEPCVFFYKPPPPIFKNILESSYPLEKMKNVPESDSNFLQYKIFLHISKGFME